ncbi:MAG: hypothetical protein CMJ78_23540 [Planctomycetaceae bacterium]|nr:hypothetical protein [Planctomycetaceae bacterium]
MLTSGLQETWAQQPGAPPAGWGQPQGVQPAGYSAGFPYSLQAPGNPYFGGSPSDTYRAGSPPASAMPWPDVNGPDYKENVFRDGWWIEESRSGKNYNFSVELLVTQTRKPQGVFGDERAQTYFQLIEDALMDSDIDDDVLALFQSDDLLGTVSPNFFDRVNFADEFGDLNSLGTRMTLEITNPDDSGLILSGWWSSDPTEQFDARSDVHQSRGTEPELLEFLLDNPLGILADISPLDPDEVLQNNLLNLRGIPLDDGTIRTFDNGINIGGVTAPFDLQFLLEIQTESYSGNVAWMMAPVYNNGYFKLRPVVGIRAIYLREELAFSGRDSGLVYDSEDDATDPFLADVKLHSTPNGVDDDGDGIIDNAGLVEDDPSGGMGGGGGGADDVRFIQFRIQDPNFPPLDTTLNNRVRSYLLGPEVGFRYDFSGKTIGISGMTKVGLMANAERISLAGNNFAMTTRDNNFIPSTPENNQPNRFNDTERHIHVSPMFETSLFVNAPVFQYLPVLRRFKLFSEANLRVGYTFTYIDHVARPSESIEYTANPAMGLFPSIDTDRHRWTIGSYSFAINWNW